VGLCGVAQNLRDELPGGYTLARLGGDEFTLIAPHIGDEQALNQLLSAVRSAVQRPIPINGEPFTTTAGLGVALYPEDAEDATKLLSIADQRMYSVKQGPEVQPQIAMGVPSQAHL
jgi:diguanylate cyclase (GGDEF)-like protein